MTLLFWQFVPLPFADQNKSEDILKTSSHISVPDKLPQYGTRLYRNVVISKQGLTEALETELQKYGLQGKLETVKQIIQAESGWDILADNGISKGIFQFTKNTWKGNCKGDIFNPYQQIYCATKLMSKGQWYRWDAFCFAHRDDSCIKLRGLYPK